MRPLDFSLSVFYNVKMDLNEENISNLAVDETAIIKKIANELEIRPGQAEAVVKLIAEGATIPFIARYRKEMHGSLDEVQVRSVDKLFTSYKNLEMRRIEIIKGIFQTGKLTDTLYENIQKAATLTELEDIWAPFKKKKKTRGMVAVEKGLTDLAEAMKILPDDELLKKAADFVTPADSDIEEALRVATVEDALAGAQDIIAEEVSQNADYRKLVHQLFLSSGKILVKGIGDEEAQKTSVYQMYWDYSEPLNEIKPHRILAINRGEREGVLEVTIDVSVDDAVALLQKQVSLPNKYYGDAIEDGAARLLCPAVVREIRRDESEAADDHGINIFSQNLKPLLMSPPIKRTRVLGVDPGIRTGTKCAALDENGKYLGHFVIYQHKADEAKAALAKAIKQYNIQLIAVGNGTGSHEVQEIVSAVIAAENSGLQFAVVDEDGASVYSAGDVAREEFPDLDLTIRGAISIGRRLQDPLAELVKIDPKSIGVGLYQHDLNQAKLSESLDEVVGSVVNNVGVNLNTASASLLKYVSGISSGLAKKIVNYRETEGIFTDRQQLKNVSGMGAKTFEQCAGFLKIPESQNPLDNTWVHPENYAAGQKIYEIIRTGKNIDSTQKSQLQTEYNVGEQTINDIVEELQKPNRDPRDDFPKPIMQQGVLNFEDLKVGMTVRGKVKNVVDFGAFVDLGLKETALLHISQMSDSFVSDPLQLVKVGDILECKILEIDAVRKRISLTRRTDSGEGGSAGKKLLTKAQADGKRVAVKKVHAVAVKKDGSPALRKSGEVAVTEKKAVANRTDRSVTKRRKDDDGMTYNPFAEFFKNKR